MTMDLEGHIAHIERSQNELRRFCADTRETTLAPWPFGIGGMITGAAIFAAGMGFAKVVEPGALSMYSGTWRSTRF
jgi:hypothetical protein